MAARASWPMPISKVPTARSIPISGRTPEGLRRLFRQFSFPGGIPSHVAPETPGSIHEGGELGYSLVHAYGAALDNPDLVVACVIGDGEAETGPLAASWHSNKFLDPVGDGAVLPILHLNGYKIANPTVLARIGDDELTRLLEGYGHRPSSWSATSHSTSTNSWPPPWMTPWMTLPGSRWRHAAGGATSRPAWPMIVLRTPKGWTGPKVSRRSAHRRDLPGSPSAGGRSPNQPWSPPDTRDLDEELSTPRPLRRLGTPARRSGRLGPKRGADE